MNCPVCESGLEGLMLSYGDTGADRPEESWHQASPPITVQRPPSTSTGERRYAYGG